jgi:hypothetical protein
LVSTEWRRWRFVFFIRNFAITARECDRQGNYGKKGVGCDLHFWHPLASMSLTQTAQA